MRVIGKKELEKYYRDHADAERPLRTWCEQVKEAEWKSPADVQQYRSARPIGNNRVVFNIKGKTYRLVAKINYEHAVVYVRFVGTHAEYDKVNAKEV